MVRHLRRLGFPRLLVLLALVAAVACLDNSITGVRELSLTITPDPASPSVGQNVDFTFNATGTGIAAVELDFGDGVADTTYVSGPVEVRATVGHTYDSAGTFTVEGTVTSAGGIFSDSISITVN